MKKLTIFLLTITLFNVNTKQIVSQAVVTGDKIINVYYGYPNYFGNVLKLAVTNTSSNDVKVNTMGPVGGSFAFMVSDHIGVGLDVNFTDVSVDWNSVDSSGVGYSYTVGASTLRVMPRFDFHFSGSDVFDAYFGVGAGYRSRTYYVESTDPNYDYDIPGALPSALRLAVGGTYFLSDNIGLNMEFGLGGGGLIRTGLSIKL
jgi:hypothetical protein